MRKRIMAPDSSELLRRVGVFAAGWVAETWKVIVEAAPWLLVGFLAAGVIHTWLSARAIATHLGSAGIRGILKAALIGVPLPLCSCSVIPVASSLRRQGASRGAVVSFLVSTPETGADSIAISYALLGPFLAIVRPVAAFVTAVAAGLIVGNVRDTDSGAGGTGNIHDVGNGPIENGSGAAGDCGCGQRGEADVIAGSIPPRIMRALRYGFVELFADLSIWLGLGFALAGLVAVLIPAGFLESHLGSGLGPMFLMLLVGLPLYVCATSSTPIAAALIARGLSPGAALVFLLAGPATNVATMLVVGRDLGRRALVLYLATISVASVLFGLAVDATMASLPAAMSAIPACDPCAEARGAWAGAVVLVLLMINGVRIRLGSPRRGLA